MLETATTLAESALWDGEGIDGIDVDLQQDDATLALNVDASRAAKESVPMSFLFGVEVGGAIGEGELVQTTLVVMAAAVVGEKADAPVAATCAEVGVEGDDAATCAQVGAEGVDAVLEDGATPWREEVGAAGGVGNTGEDDEIEDANKPCRRRAGLGVVPILACASSIFRSKQFILFERASMEADSGRRRWEQVEQSILSYSAVLGSNLGKKLVDSQEQGSGYPL